MKNGGMGGEGFEPVSETPGETQVHDLGGIKSGNKGAGSRAPSPPDHPADPDLAAVVAAWSGLAAATRAAVLALVTCKTAADGGVGK